MTDRLLLAYSLIALLALAGAAIIAWKVYHSRSRTHARQRARMNKRHRQRAAQDAARIADGDNTRG
jgi:type II secretory pathway component PulJ